MLRKCAFFFNLKACITHTCIHTQAHVQLFLCLVSHSLVTYSQKGSLFKHIPQGVRDITVFISVIPLFMSAKKNYVCQVCFAIITDETHCLHGMHIANSNCVTPLQQHCSCRKNIHVPCGFY